MFFIGWQKTTIKTSNGNVEGIAPIIVSASRATDIPALYGNWFLHRLTQGYAKGINRFSGQPQYVSFEKARVFVFWTKNPEPFIKYQPELERNHLNYYFTHSLNDYEAEGRLWFPERSTRSTVVPRIILTYYQLISLLQFSSYIDSKWALTKMFTTETNREFAFF